MAKNHINFSSLVEANQQLNLIREATINQGLVGGVKKIRDITYCSLKEAHDFINTNCKEELIRHRLNNQPCVTYKTSKDLPPGWLHAYTEPEKATHIPAWPWPKEELEEKRNRTFELLDSIKYRTIKSHK